MKKKTSSQLRLTAIVATAISALLIVLAEFGIGADTKSIVVVSNLVVLAAWGLLVVALWYLAQSIEKREQQMRDEFNVEMQAAREESFSQGFRELFKRLVLKSDILSQIQTWLTTSSQTRESNDQRATRLLELLMVELRQHGGLECIPVGRVVRFDPKQHRTHDRLRLGEESVVIEPGWLLASDMIKMPVVRRMK